MANEVKKKKKPYSVPIGEPGPELHKCMPCGYIYDDSKMGARFADLTDSYRCPLCSARLDAFVDISTGG